MTSATATTLSEVEVFRHLARSTQMVLRMNVDGITHQESLIHPQPAGNCVNWVIGHLLWVYGNVLPLLEQQPVVDQASLRGFERGASPLLDPNEAHDFTELMNISDATTARIDEGFANLTSDQLDARAPFSPTNNPNETVRSLLTVVSFHQAYHAGQTGLLRRVVGKAGAIA
jgi:DinB family protein